MWDEATSGIDFLYELNPEKPKPAKIWSRWRGRSPSARIVNRAANKKCKQEKGNNIAICKELESISPVYQNRCQNTNDITTQTQARCVDQKRNFFFYQGEIALTSFCAWTGVTGIAVESQTHKALCDPSQPPVVPLPVFVSFTRTRSTDVKHKCSLCALASGRRPETMAPGHTNASVSNGIQTYQSSIVCIHISSIQPLHPQPHFTPTYTNTHTLTNQDCLCWRWSWLC